MSTEGAPTEAQVSWQVERTTMPERPDLESSLPEEERISRPRRCMTALVLCCVSAAFIAAAIAVSAFQLDSITDGLLETLPTDLTDEYSTDDLNTAVSVLLAAIAGSAALLMLVQLLSMRTLVLRRRAGSRIAYVTLCILMLPVLIVAVLVREANALDLALAGGAALSMLLAAILICTPRASHWLRQSEERRSITIAKP